MAWPGWWWVGGLTRSGREVTEKKTSLITRGFNRRVHPNRRSRAPTSHARFCNALLWIFIYTILYYDFTRYFFFFPHRSLLDSLFILYYNHKISFSTPIHHIL